MNSNPKESKIQEIGRLADRVFCSQILFPWIEKDQSGHTDFGIDYLIQVKNSNEPKQ